MSSPVCRRAFRSEVLEPPLERGHVLEPAQRGPDEGAREVDAPAHALGPGDRPLERIGSRCHLAKLAARPEVLEECSEHRDLLLALRLPEGLRSTRRLGADLATERDLEQTASVGLRVERLGEPRASPPIGLPEGEDERPHEALLCLRVRRVQDLAGLEEAADAEVVLPLRGRLAQEGAQRERRALHVQTRGAEPEGDLVRREERVEEREKPGGPSDLPRGGESLVGHAVAPQDEEDVVGAVRVGPCGLGAARAVEDDARHLSVRGRHQLAHRPLHLGHRSRGQRPRPKGLVEGVSAGGPPSRGL